jgi:sulfite reductase (NADPH) flavoprotein alpha-component
MSRNNPSLVKIRERYLLNKEGSSKQTYHIVLDNPDLPFQVGDSIGVMADNDPLLVDAILEEFGSNPMVKDRSGAQTSFRDFLLKKGNISKCTSAILKLFHAKDLPPSFLHTHQFLDILRVFPGTRPSAQELASALLPLMPRFYSIASSARMYPHEIHLTVALLTYDTVGGPRFGVGSHFLCHSAELMKTPVSIYVQPSNGFTLPDPHASIILIGPGTGIAPFRAFLQERMALQHPGRNWLFFGERNRATDFYYADYFQSLAQTGRLYLDTAFSRDTPQKHYVQHCLWEHRSEIFSWLQSGAYLYVCGDAEKMAKDVDLTLHRIGREFGHTEESARNWLRSLRKERRYLLDVY